MGDVIGDLNSRRGLVGEFLDKPGNMRVRLLTKRLLLAISISLPLMLWRYREPHHLFRILLNALHQSAAALSAEGLLFVKCTLTCQNSTPQ